MPTKSARQKEIEGRRLRIAAAVLFVLAAALWIWDYLSRPAVGPEAGFDNLVLITMDTTRADRLGCYGWPDAHTPNLDRLALRGLRFDRCFTTAPYTLPAHASILTGRYPGGHGLRVNGVGKLPESVGTLAGWLSEAGFTTGAVVSSRVLDSRYGLDRGFESFNDDLGGGSAPGLLLYRETPAKDALIRTRQWLELVDAKERFFLWTHFFDPHDPYEPPAEFAEALPGSAYDAEIAYVDACIGQLVQWLDEKGVGGRTLIAVMGDHGESLGDHGEGTHGLFVYDATMRVPWLLSHPSLPQGGIVQNAVSVTDFVPTVLELLDISAPEDELHGRSHARNVLNYRKVAPDRVIYSEAMHSLQKPGWADLRTLRTNEMRYIEAPRPELYDSLADINERRNLFGQRDVSAFIDRMRKFDVEGVTAEALPAARDEALAIDELGYVQSVGGSQSRTGIDPKDVVQQVEATQSALRAIRVGRYAEAAQSLAPTVAQNPADLMARSLLLGCQLALRQTSKMRALLEAGRRARPGSTEAILFAQQFGPPVQGSAQSWVLAQQLDTRSSLAWFVVARKLDAAGNASGAARAWREVIEREARWGVAWVERARALARIGQDLPAAQAAETAKQRDPYDATAHLWLGDRALAAGEHETAQRHFEDALRLLRLDARPVLGLFQVAVARDDWNAAETLLRAALERAADPAAVDNSWFLITAPALDLASLRSYLDSELIRRDRRNAWEAAAKAATHPSLAELSAAAQAHLAR